METIAFFNLKGGVGKTTSAVNIAWHAASEGIPTLLWDLDPQGAASWLLQTRAKGKTQPKQILSGKTPLGDLVKSTGYAHLDIIPAAFSLRTFEQTLDFFKQNKLKPKRLHAFFTMVDRRRSLHRVILAHPPKMLKHRLPTPIPYAAVIERMGDYQAPLPAFDSVSPVSLAYAQLWQDIKTTLKDF